ncbi:hypothetical protein B4907_21525 [Yersinia kristensenii]|nr:hypothetical protein B4907_21525 [Yersinia kristensenii]
MIGEGAHLAVGIDPMQLFLCQFVSHSQVARRRPTCPCAAAGY